MKFPNEISTKILAKRCATERLVSKGQITLQTKGRTMNPIRYRCLSGRRILRMIYNRNTRFHEIIVPLPYWPKLATEIYSTELPQPLIPLFETLDPISPEKALEAADALKENPGGAGTRMPHDPTPALGIPYPVKHDDCLVDEDGKRLSGDGRVLPETMPPFRGLNDPPRPLEPMPVLEPLTPLPPLEEPDIPAPTQTDEQLDLAKEIERELAGV